MSLKALAQQRLAQIRAAETARETTEKQTKQGETGPETCFTEEGSCFTPMKHGNPQKTAKNNPCFTVSLPRGETHETRLPVEIAEGVRKLGKVHAPRGVRASVWAGVVLDARRLVLDGWAFQMLALGWEPLHIFGVDTSPEPEPWDQALCVVLRGRAICAVADAAVFFRTDGGTHLFNRRARPGLSKFLWELGA